MERWRIVAAAAALVTLTAVVGWQLTRPVPTPAAIPPLVTGSPPADGAEIGEPSGTSEAGVLAAAEAAVEAWGRFATSGDLKALEGHFDPAGPQYQQLVSETADRAADPAQYQLRMAHPRATPNGGDGGSVVTGEVLMSRYGHPAGVWTWRVQLRHDRQHGWRVWTVTSLAQDG